MDIWQTYTYLRMIALSEFTDVITSARVTWLAAGGPFKLRLNIIDGSLLNIHLSTHGRYSYHGEQRLLPQGGIYRHDNAPHYRWREISTFPKHFHSGRDNHVLPSHLSDSPSQALREFLAFVRLQLVHKE